VLKKFGRRPEMSFSTISANSSLSPPFREVTIRAS
jgi:hypothetical protein